MLKINQKAPNFELLDQQGKNHKLSDYKGKWILLYFYPKDHTPGCIIEACKIRDNFENFSENGIEVLGISTDSVESHGKFAKDYKLPFTLLADDKKKVVKLYDVWGEKKFLGKTYQGTKRMSYLINPKGKIAKIYPKVKPAIHAQEVLSDLKNLKL